MCSLFPCQYILINSASFEISRMLTDAEHTFGWGVSVFLRIFSSTVAISTLSYLKGCIQLFFGMAILLRVLALDYIYSLFGDFNVYSSAVDVRDILQTSVVSRLTKKVDKGILFGPMILCLVFSILWSLLVVQQHVHFICGPGFISHWRLH